MNNDYWLLPQNNLELQTLHALASYYGLQMNDNS